MFGNKGIDGVLVGSKSNTKTNNGLGAVPSIIEISYQYQDQDKVQDKKTLKRAPISSEIAPTQKALYRANKLPFPFPRFSHFLGQMHQFD